MMFHIQQEAYFSAWHRSLVLSPAFWALRSVTSPLHRVVLRCNGGETRCLHVWSHCFHARTAHVWQFWELHQTWRRTRVPSLPSFRHQITAPSFSQPRFPSLAHFCYEVWESAVRDGRRLRQRADKMTPTWSVLLYHLILFHCIFSGPNVKDDAEQHVLFFVFFNVC